MIELETQIHVPSLRAQEITDFFLTCDDAAYQRWWPGTHLSLHNLDGEPGRIGSLVYMDEFVGRRRVRMTGEIREFIPGKRIVWQLRQFIRLPVRLTLELADESDGVRITHSVRAGFGSAGRVFDSILNLWFDEVFRRDLDEHVRLEFPLLRDNVIRCGQMAADHSPPIPDRD